MTAKGRSTKESASDNGSRRRLRQPDEGRRRRQGPERGLPNFRSIEIFVTTVEEQSLTSAARRLSLTQSAVSHAIANLEASLGHSLLDRSTRPPKLTIAGSLLYDRATEILNKMRALGQTLAFDLKQQLPMICIGMVDSVAATAWPQILKRIGGLADRWSLRSTTPDIGVQALRERRIDLTITTEEWSTSDDIYEVPIYREPLVLCVPKSAPTTWNSARELSRHLDLVRYRSSSFIGMQIKEYLNRQGLELPEKYELDTSDAIVAMVKAGMGWTITTPLLLLKAAAGGASRPYQVHPLESPRVLRTLRVACRKTDSAALARFVAEATSAVLETHLPALKAIAPWADSIKILR